MSFKYFRHRYFNSVRARRRKTALRRTRRKPFRAYPQFEPLEARELLAAVTIHGDYNQDGGVDTADYVVWRKSVGQQGAELVADGNGDRIVDAADHMAWQQNFGKMLGTDQSAYLTALPEAGQRLVAIGTAGDDDLIVERHGDILRASFATPGNGNRMNFDFPAAVIDEVFFSAMSGDDTFENLTTLPAIALGGDGNDHLIGGAANDFLVGGIGNDSILGGDGDDYLVGEDIGLQANAGDSFAPGSGENTVIGLPTNLTGAGTILTGLGLVSPTFLDIQPHFNGNGWTQEYINIVENAVEYLESVLTASYVGERIDIAFSFGKLDKPAKNILASARPSYEVGTPRGLAPIALANHLAKRDLNQTLHDLLLQPAPPEIVVTIDSPTFPELKGDHPTDFRVWQTGLIIHEIMHGLGFMDGRSEHFTDPANGNFRTTVRFHETVFTSHIVTSTGKRYSTDPSGLYDGMDGSRNVQLLWDGELGSGAEIYAPSSPDPGSSLSHVADSNKLMYFRANGIDTLSPVEKGILADMGWTVLGDIDAIFINNDADQWRLATLEPGGSRKSVYSLNFSGPPGKTPLLGDWDGDGTTDFGVYFEQPFGGHHWVLVIQSQDGPPTVRYPNFGGGPGEIPIVGDWDGNGRDDIGVYIASPPPNGRNWVLAPLNANGSRKARWAPNFGGGPGEVPVVGDWDNNGVTDIGVYIQTPPPGGDHWILTTLRDNGTRDRTWAPNFGGGPGELPVVGDWDGNGSDDIGVYIVTPPAGGSHWVLAPLNSDGSRKALWAANFGGGPGELPVVGDWDGNGTDDIGVYIATPPAGGSHWVVAPLNPGGSRKARWAANFGGGLGEAPLVGDWDGDGIFDVGVYVDSAA